MTTINSSRSASLDKAPAPPAKRLPVLLQILLGCIRAATFALVGWLMIQFPDLTEDFTPRGAVAFLIWLVWSTPTGVVLLVFSALMLRGSIRLAHVAKPATA